ncbi:MAG: hypothetical protein E8D45_00890 [Nitrospira sp.]|nr:MAG: hypothetical protein E8D45_00890 [Nitrospira sp.]
MAMNRVAGLVLVFVVTSITEALGEPAHRPMEEMRGGCADYALNVRAELAAMEQASRPVKSLATREEVAPIMPGLQPISITFLNADGVSLTVTPKRSGSSAGLLPIAVPRDGRYRISADTALWIEVVAGQERLEPQAFEMQTGCSTLFKTVVYELKAGPRYWMELSGNVKTARVLLSDAGGAP